MATAAGVDPYAEDEDGDTLSDRHVLGLDLRSSFVGGRTGVVNPVFGAEQITGTLGSPGATTTVSGKQLPSPDPKFGGVIKDNALQSKA